MTSGCAVLVISATLLVGPGLAEDYTPLPVLCGSSEFGRQGRWYAAGQRCVVPVLQARSWEAAAANCTKWPVQITNKALPPFTGQLVDFDDPRQWRWLVAAFDVTLDKRLDQMLGTRKADLLHANERQKWGLHKRNNTLKEQQYRQLLLLRLQQAAFLGNGNSASSNGRANGGEPAEPSCAGNVPHTESGQPVPLVFDNATEQCVQISGGRQPMAWADASCDRMQKYFCQFTETTTTKETCEPEGLFLDNMCFTFGGNQKQVNMTAAHLECTKRGAVLASVTSECSRRRLVAWARRRGIGRFWVGLRASKDEPPQLQMTFSASECGAKPVELEFDGPELQQPSGGGNGGDTYRGGWMMDVGQGGKLIRPLFDFELAPFMCMERDCGGELRCDNAGACFRMPNNRAKCICRPGYFGELCEGEGADCNPCDSDPCHADNTDKCQMQLGNATESAGDDVWYECRCSPGYSGEHCEHEIDECDSDPCVNGATCTDHFLHYTCDCVPGFTGAHCQINIDECASEPCIHGECVDLINAFACMCEPGYTSRLCAIDMDECESRPCQNHGFCSNQIALYTCACVPAFTGVDCEVALTSCTWEMLEHRGSNIAMMAQQTTSCIIVIVCMSSLLVIFLLLLDFSYERMLHMGEELALLVAFIMLLLFRNKSMLGTGAFCDMSDTGDPVTLSPFMCTLQAIAFHYVFLVYFILLAAEAVHSYTVFTHVVISRPFIKGKHLIAATFGIPFVIVAYTAVRHFHTYTSDTTCWVAVSSVNFTLFELLPVALFSSIALVVSEATGMTDYTDLPQADQAKRWTAQAMAKGGLLIPLLSFFAWLIGIAAVDGESVAFTTCQFVLNILLCTCICLFHTLGNQRARLVLRLLLWDMPRELCGCAKPENDRPSVMARLKLVMDRSAPVPVQQAAKRKDPPKNKFESKQKKKRLLRKKREQEKRRKQREKEREEKKNKEKKKEKKSEPVELQEVISGKGNAPMMDELQPVADPDFEIVVSRPVSLSQAASPPQPTANNSCSRTNSNAKPIVSVYRNLLNGASNKTLKKELDDKIAALVARKREEAEALASSRSTARRQAAEPRVPFFERALDVPSCPHAPKAPSPQPVGRAKPSPLRRRNSMPEAFAPPSSLAWLRWTQLGQQQQQPPPPPPPLSMREGHQLLSVLPPNASASLPDLYPIDGPADGEDKFAWRRPWRP